MSGSNLLSAATHFQLLAGDQFTQANGALSANWTVDTTAVAPTVVSNQVQNTANLGAGASALYTAVTFPNDQWASISLVSLLSSSVGILLRARTTLTVNEYRCFLVSPLGATSVLHIAKVVAGAFTDLNTATINSAAGDVILFSAQGTALNAYQNNVLRVTTTDPDIAGGIPGILVSNAGTATDSIIDNFNAGSVK